MRGGEMDEMTREVFRMSGMADNTIETLEDQRKVNENVVG